MNPTWNTKSAVENGPSPVEGEPGGTENATHVRAEPETEAEQPEQRGGHEQSRERLDRDVDRVLRPHQPALKGGEAGLHEQHERRADEQPGNIDRPCARHRLTLQVGASAPPHIGSQEQRPFARGRKESVSHHAPDAIG
jgi:hypothetical protein